MVFRKFTKQKRPAKRAENSQGIYAKKEVAAREEREAEKMEIAWGSQIRSYVLQPYQKIKDHRTGVEESNVTRVLDGDIDPFIEGYLLQFSDKN